jgi:hypothetical protein
MIDLHDDDTDRLHLAAIEIADGADPQATADKYAVDCAEAVALSRDVLIGRAPVNSAAADDSHRR